MRCEKKLLIAGVVVSFFFGAAGSRAAQPVAPGYSRFLLGAYRKTMLIETEIQQACDRYKVPYPLARAVCIYESGGNDALVSSTGARGYFQVMPRTHRLMNVPTNIEAGVKYLGEMIQRLGREDDALAGYNAGPGRVARGKPMPVETLQYVVGIGYLRTLLLLEESGLRDEAANVMLHRVAAGETWLDISKATGTSILELRLYNPYLAQRLLTAGQLVAYPKEPSAPSEMLKWSFDRSAWLYKTLPGDLYLHLAFALNVPLEQMRSENNLWRIQTPIEGIDLAIRPSQPFGEGEPHVVVQGETIEDIAKQNGIDPWDMIRANSLWDQKIVPGYVLRLPRSSSQAPLSAVASASAATAPPASARPVAQAGAEAEGATQDRGGSIVPLESIPGPRPASAPVSYRIHRVRKGDTLFRIAQLYGTTVERIRGFNGLSGKTLAIGQSLRIPLQAAF